MKRQAIRLEQIADYENLLLAAHKAARAKKHRASVQAFFANLTQHVRVLSEDIVAERLPYGRFRAFEIY